MSSDLLALQEQVIRRGFSIGLYDETSALVVLNGLGRGEARERVKRLVQVVTDFHKERALDVIDGFRGRDLRAIRGLVAATPKAPALCLAWVVRGIT